MSAVVWLRRDLRLSDHHALSAAQSTGLPITVLYIHEADTASVWQTGSASRVWLDRSLRALDAQLRKIGGKLLIRSGPPLQVLVDLCEEVAATHVFWHRLYEPDAVTRDTEVKAQLQARGITVESFPGHLLNEPWALKTGLGEVYRVFTPYWRKARLQITISAPLSAPTRLSLARTINGELPVGLSVDALRLQAKPEWDREFWQYFVPGELGATEALAVFLEGALAHYIQGRDRPDQVGTSKLGPYLHFGEISVNQIAYRFAQQLPTAVQAHAEFYLRELGWRDFSHQLLFYFPHTTTQPLNQKFASFQWADIAAAETAISLRAWQQGQTGIPIIDAGMRELWRTGWMHNRVRMIVASFLTKNLRIHWLHGAKWFWDTLLDADLANNTQGWQWSAGSGADAAPYFRIFNPVSQGEKFDPNGDYVRKYVPELAHLPNKSIHQPWISGGAFAYPKPIIDLKDSRAAALVAYAEMRARH